MSVEIILDSEITLEALRTCGYEKYISQSDSNIHDYQAVLAKAAQEAKENGNNTHSNALGLLSIACSLSLQPANPDQPFVPFFSIGNQRSAIPSDFKAEHSNLFAQLTPEVQDSELASRLGDLSWVISRKANFAAAQIAVKAYVNASESAYCQQFWFQKINRLERALRLAVSLKEQKEVDNILTLLLKQLDPDDNEFTLETTNRICHMLLELNLVDPITIAERALTLVDKASDNIVGFDLQYDLFSTAEKGFLRAQDFTRSETAKIMAAETLIRKAELAKKSPDQLIAAAHWLHQGVTALQQCKGQKDRVRDLQVDMIALNKATLGEMKKYSLQLDLTDLVNSATSAMQNKDRITAILQFAFLFKPIQYIELENQVIKLSSEMVFCFSATKSIYNSNGRLVAKASPLLGSTGEEYKFALKIACHEQASYHYQSLVQGIILPAHNELLKLHEIDKNILSEILQNCAFIPPERKSSWVKGFFFGFQGDFEISLSLLIPQLEHALRRYLETLGVNVCHIDPKTKLHSEMNLNTLLELPEACNFLGKDLQFTLQCLLVEHLGSGSNIRNEFGHGLMSEAGFYSPSAIYLWWLFFHMAISFSHVVSQQPSDETEEKRK